MGVVNTQKRRRFTGILAVALAVIVVLSTRSMSDFDDREVCREWAAVDLVIPQVTFLPEDSLEWNTLDEVTFVSDSALPSEAYRIVSDENGITVFHGKQGNHRAQSTLNQLHMLGNQAVLPWGEIQDAPAFAHRGVLLDVCRHFFTVAEVKRQLDIMALYKFNVLHWHLTEDQGWRIAMDAYPKLAEVAAYRSYGDSVYGGSYSRKDLEEVVAYAGGLGIEVIPEIELPGHSQAVIAAYPELGCTGGPVEVATEWGVFKEIYCAGNEQTFDFLEDVLDYVCSIFPSKYIHIGGDEAPKYRWEHCEKCQQRMRSEGLANEEVLQGWFNARIEAYLATKGKQISGWDEILEGGLSPNATVQSWRGFEGGIAAAAQGHDAIMSPTSHAYFDYPTSSIDVPKVYSFDPVPEDLDTALHRYILGGECNLWSERIPDIQTLDRRFLPRGIAMAEVLWSYPKERDYANFSARLQEHYPVLDTLGYAYDLEQVPVEVNAKNRSNSREFKLEVAVLPRLPKLELNVKLNGQSQRQDVLLTDRGVSRLTVQPARDGRSLGPELAYEYALHEGLLTHSCMTSTPTAPYTGSPDIPLADGQLGSLNFRDGKWLGFYGPNEFSGHFGWEIPYQIDSVKINFLQSRLSWILVPEVVYADIYIESDVIERVETFRKSTPADEGTFIETMLIAPPGGFRPTKSLDFRIPNREVLPENHPAAGQRVWHFIDEIQIYGRPV